jgi:very-short-patch-repair endonuclease
MGWEMSERYNEAPLDWLAGYIDFHASQMGAKCESPIEIGLLRAFIALRLGDRRIRLEGMTTGAVLTEWEATVYPQHRVGDFRVDFAVEIAVGSNSAWLGIECDGHDFHERTKEQAARDKSRDRALTAAGYRMMRFTGSEIYKDNMACALQVHSFIMKLAWEMAA